MRTLQSQPQTARILILLAVAVAVALALACRQSPPQPARSSPEYNELVRTFYIGLAALQVGHDVQADAKLAQFTQLAPAEPAGWANWGLLALRQQNFDTAAERLERARSLADDNGDIYYLVGLLESSRGKSAEAITALRKAIELNPKNLVATYKLAEEVEREGNQREFQRLVQQILTTEPNNLAALIELTRVAAKRGDVETLEASVEKIAARSALWPPEVQQQVTALQQATNSGDLNGAATRTTFLRNVLVRVPEYQRALAAIKPPPGEEAVPFTQFLKMETPVFRTAPADTALQFKAEPLSGTTDGTNWVGAFSLNGEGPPIVATATGSELRLSEKVVLPFPGVAEGRFGVLPIDFNYDFKTDLVLAGGKGVRLFKQESAEKFTDVTAATKLPAEILNGNYTGAWAADIEADGDLDIVLGGSHKVLRNNSDGTFVEIRPFSDISVVDDFVWGDIDADGDPEAALIDASGMLHVFANERQGHFIRWLLPAGFMNVAGLAIAELNNDSVLDLVVASNTGVITRLSDKDHGTNWEKAELAKAADVGGPPRLWAADLDNNGGLDLVWGSNVLLSDENGKFTPIKTGLEQQRLEGVADVNGDGRLDLLAVSTEGKAIRAINSGSKNYHWQVVRPRAVQATGDQRINSFGIGGEMEIRAGLLVQKQPITAPVVHFGLGDQTTTDVIRVTWPNGSVRADFEIKADQTVVTEQRLKGSCPFLFAWNGKQMEFVKDSVPWGSAIGLRINTLGTARVEATEEWYKISRNQLVPRNGYYDLRITAELWETYYYDQLSLMVVDHPADTEIFVDERFVIPAAKLAITTVSTPRPVASAIDDNGQDVTSEVKSLDGNYLDTFGRGNYQGVTRDHYVEVDLGNDVPTRGPLWLIAHGWMHPTDSSINVAISQGQQEQAKALSLEVPDGRGGWEVAKPNLGFPAGRKKICLFDLANVFKPGTPRKVRLRTNLEIYWDLLEWATAAPAAAPKITHLNPELADLHYRGYSVINQANASSPEIPDYNRLSGSKQIWRDLIGYYTRFGDVRELLLRADDRYVIMNAGDEMSFRFAAPAAPPAGWVRDYVIVGDGWIKDGDYNSTFGKTVLPLPYHAKNLYDTPPSRLEDEWVYRRFPDDWQKYHTRYVTADGFQNAMRSKHYR
ncbi:MAG: FG-GAP-like repeat-containing protein [Acidobacteria bacterium]|nr:FG-GAP-like repeat-containing protein [Acidobacteriota bacterium]